MNSPHHANNDEILSDEVYDAFLLEIAKERFANFDPDTVLSEAELIAMLGINAEDLENFRDIELEV